VFKFRFGFGSMLAAEHEHEPSTEHSEE